MAWVNIIDMLSELNLTSIVYFYLYEIVELVKLIHSL